MLASFEHLQLKEEALDSHEKELKFEASKRARGNQAFCYWGHFVGHDSPTSVLFTCNKFRKPMQDIPGTANAS